MLIGRISTITRAGSSSAHIALGHLLRCERERFCAGAEQFDQKHANRSAGPFVEFGFIHELNCPGRRFHREPNNLERGGNVLPESLNDAYIEAVKACGGSKVVGMAIWPAKGVEAAQRHLLACLNPDRNEKLSPDEALHIERMAREVGCHVVMQYRADTLGYAEPVPIDPRDELAELLRQNIELRKSAQRMDERIERLMQPARSIRAAA